MWKYDDYTIVIFPDNRIVAYKRFGMAMRAVGAGCESMMGSTYRNSIETWHVSGRSLDAVKTRR